MKDYDKNNESLYLKYWIQRIYMADNFESTKDAFPFNEDFIKS